MYKLVKISPIGRRDTVADDIAPDALIEAGALMTKKYPGVQFGVSDEFGFFVWPPKLAAAHVGPREYHPLVKEEYV